MQTADPLEVAGLEDVVHWLENEPAIAGWSLSVENRKGGIVTRLVFRWAGSAAEEKAVRLTFHEDGSCSDFVVDFIPAPCAFEPAGVPGK